MYLVSFLRKESSHGNSNTKVSQKFCNILVYASLQCIYHVTKAVLAVEGTLCVW